MEGLDPSDVILYAKYDLNLGDVEWEAIHKPTGCNSGMQKTYWRAYEMLAEGVEEYRKLKEAKDDQSVL